MKRFLRSFLSVLAAWVVFLFLQTVLSHFAVFSEDYSVVRNLLPALVATLPPLLISAQLCRYITGSARPFLISVVVLFLPILLLQLRENGALLVGSYSTLFAVLFALVGCFFPNRRVPRKESPASTDAPPQYGNQDETPT